MNPATVCVDFNVHGAWDVELPYEREPVTCETLDEATRVAYQCASDRRPCELIVRDAYHRVLRRELVNGEHTAPPRASA
jgi:hypothetical protein